MLDEAPRHGPSSISNAAAKLIAVAVLFTFPIIGYPSQRTAHAATSPQAVQGPSPPRSEQRQPGQSEQGAHQMPNTQAKPGSPGPAITLAELERMALATNPTLAQAEQAISAAEGRRLQAGLWPNPIMGYSLTEGAFRAFTQKSEHSLFVEQNILLGGKLKKSRNILAQEKVQAEQDAVAQKQRVLNAVRMLFYEALGAQQLVEVRGQLATLAREAVSISGELFNVGQSDRPDVLEIEIEAERAQLDLIKAENDREQIWQELAAVVGNPEIKPMQLAGDIEKGLPVFDQESMLATILRESPEVRRAQAGIERARAALARAKAEPVPDLFVRGSIGYSSELLETFPPRPPATKTGPEAALEVGVRIPLFNRNQGGIAAASAELEIAEREARRVELTLRARMSGAFRAYQNALRVATRYQSEVIPRAQSGYEMYLTKFRQMAAAYPQVLIAQRTLFQVRAHYIRAQVNVWQGATLIQGLLLTGGLDVPASSGIQGAGEPRQRTGASIERHGDAGQPDR